MTPIRLHEYFKSLIFIITDNDNCPAPLIRDSDLQLTSCVNGIGFCNAQCPVDNVVFAPVPNYMSCGHLGVWDRRKPYEDLVLPGCSSKLFFFMQ